MVLNFQFIIKWWFAGYMGYVVLHNVMEHAYN